MLPLVVEVEPKRHEQVWPAKRGKAEGSYNDISHEQGKMTFIIEADTLIYPWAMVVILQHTAVAYPAVVCPLRFGSSTLGTSTRRCRGYIQVRRPANTIRQWSAGGLSFLRPDEAVTRAWWVTGEAGRYRAGEVVVRE